MPHGRPSPALSLSVAERESLERWASGRDRRLARRAALVLGFAGGEDGKVLARRFRLSEPTVGKWRTRFEASRLDGLLDAARPGAPRRILAEDVERVISYLRQPPPEGLTRWTTRSLARVCGVSQTTVSRIWRARGVDPRLGTPPEPADGASPAAGGASTTAGPRSDQPHASELTRLAHDLSELATAVPSEQAPYLRVALEAITAALTMVAGPRVRRARDSAVVTRGRMEAALTHARELVKQAKDRMAELRAVRDAMSRQTSFIRPGSPGRHHLLCPRCGRDVVLSYDASAETPAVRTRMTCPRDGCGAEMDITHPARALNVRLE